MDFIFVDFRFLSILDSRNDLRTDQKDDEKKKNKKSCSKGKVPKANMRPGPQGVETLVGLKLKTQCQTRRNRGCKPLRSNLPMTGSHDLGGCGLDPEQSHPWGSNFRSNDPDARQALSNDRGTLRRPANTTQKR